MLVKGGNNCVAGELVELSDEAAVLRQLDQFEGSEYRREKIEVTTEAGKKKKAWVYLYCKNFSPDAAVLIESGDWIEFENIKR